LNQTTVGLQLSNAARFGSIASGLQIFGELSPLRSEPLNERNGLVSPVVPIADRIALMISPEFVAYVGIPDLHDGIVLRVAVEGKTAEVVVDGFSGRQHTVRFEGVETVRMNQPEGMLLYSISEMRAAPPLREFVFTNNDENHPGSLSILATGFSIRSD
jgi:hypothetical protein